LNASVVSRVAGRFAAGTIAVSDTLHAGLGGLIARWLGTAARRAARRRGTCTANAIAAEAASRVAARPAGATITCIWRYAIRVERAIVRLIGAGACPNGNGRQRKHRNEVP